MVFLAFLDQMACREYRAFPDRRDPREEKVQKGKLELRDAGSKRGCGGPSGKSGPRGIKGMKGEPGLVGMKGEPGIVGNQGRKGDKGEKEKASKQVKQE